MANLASALAKRFTRRSPATLLALGIALSLLDSLALYTAAAKESVLHIDQGVGLLENYGLFSTVLGNAIFLYLGKKYYDAICSIKSSKAVIDSSSIQKSLAALTAHIQMRGKAQFLIYLLIIIGALSWLSNISSHVLGNSEVRWGHKVFDSPEHPLTFCASRLHNLYTWVIIMPFVGHVVIFSSNKLWRMMTSVACGNIFRYDLLNPDQRGGFAFVDKAAIAFNSIAALAYIQITMHIGTFKVNSDHVIAYIFATMILIVVNKMFFSGVYSAIKTLKLEALNKVKDKALEDDALSFEILKYCYERRVSIAPLLRFAINTVAVAASGVIKLWPLISKLFI